MNNLDNAGLTQNDFAAFAAFPNFNFSNFKSFETFAHAKKFFAANDFFVEKGTFEFLFFAPPSEEDFAGFADFILKEIAPEVESGSFLKFNFFFSNFNSEFRFAGFSKFFDQFLKNGSKIEFSFFPLPTDFNFDNFDFLAEFDFPFEFLFSVRQASNR